MRTKHCALLVASFVLAGCVAWPPTTPIDATMDSPRPSGGAATFTLDPIDHELVVTRGDRITLDVHVVRQGGFAEPILVELAGLPDACSTLAREARVGDELTTLTIVAAEDGEPIAHAAFVVQASTLDGLRQTAPARITVR